MRQRGRRRVLRGTNAEMFSDALPQLLVHFGHGGFAVELEKPVAFGHQLQSLLDHSLIADERAVAIVGDTHVAVGFPIADRLRLLEVARKRGFWTHVEPELEMRAKS